MAEGDRYALVARTNETRSVLLWLDTFDSYDAALAAHASATEHLSEYAEKVKEYAVRSLGDPAVSRTYARTDDYFHGGRTRGAVREARRKEIGATASAFIRIADVGASLDALIEKARESLNKRGYKVERHEVEAAVKGRVTIARCRSTAWTRGCDRAYWVKKGEARIHDLRCSHCEGRLSQTTLAFRASFRRLAVAKTKAAA